MLSSVPSPDSVHATCGVPHVAKVVRVVDTGPCPHAAVIIHPWSQRSIGATYPPPTIGFRMSSSRRSLVLVGSFSPLHDPTKTRDQET
jgi:hypothetical protein